MSILDCYGQNAAIAQLQRARTARRLPHSYIFQGPEGVGKSLLARQWAKLMLCGQPQKRPWSPGPSPSDHFAELAQIDDCCDQCHDCRLVDADNHPDLHLIKKELIRHASQGRDRKMINLPIDVIREFVIAPAGTHPSRGKARIFIIDQAETMNRPAQNALLKTLEEPPQSTFLLLISSRSDLFLPTVRSRCQLIRFASLPIPFVTERLLAAGIPPQQAHYWADFSDGRLGTALAWAQSKLYPVKSQLLEQLVTLNKKTVLLLAGWMVDRAAEYAKAFLEDHPGYSTTDAARHAQIFLLQVLAHAFGQTLRTSMEAFNTDAQRPDQYDLIQQLARKYQPDHAAQAIGHTLHAESQLQANVNPTLIFESLMLHYLHDAAAPAGPNKGQF